MRTSRILAVIIALSFVTTVVAQPQFVPAAPPLIHTLKPVYRFYNPQSGDHLYTAVPGLEAPVVATQYVPEGIAFYVYSMNRPDRAPLYRFYKPSGGHFYATTIEAGQPFGAQLERVVGYLSLHPRARLRPLYVWYNAQLDRHFYTTDPGGEYAPLNGYEYLGTLGYVAPSHR